MAGLLSTLVSRLSAQHTHTRTRTHTQKLHQQAATSDMAEGKLTGKMPHTHTVTKCYTHLAHSAASFALVSYMQVLLYVQISVH